MRGNSYYVPAQTPACVKAPIIRIIKYATQVRTSKTYVTFIIQTKEIETSENKK